MGISANLLCAVARKIPKCVTYHDELKSESGEIRGLLASAKRRKVNI